MSEFALADQMDRLMRDRMNVNSYIYVYTATVKSKQVVKIGVTDNLKQRLEQVEKCTQFEDLVERYSAKVLFRKRAEDLAHLELSHFQWDDECSCGKAHREWFTVDANVAVQVVKRWVDFVQHAYDSRGTLRDHWSQRVEIFVNATPEPESEEVRTRINGDLEKHHDIRHERYSGWIEETKRRDPFLRCLPWELS
jgi:hypothetical protein